MKKLIPAILGAIALVIASCSGKDADYFSSLDRSIEKQEMYDLIHTHSVDSLRLLCQMSSSRAAKWKASRELYNYLNYNDIDSCYLSVKDMLRYSGNDHYRQTVSRVCYASILYKMDSLQAARRVLERIDTAGMDHETRRAYYNAAYHIYGLLGHDQKECIPLKWRVVEQWWKIDSTRLDCAYYHNVMLRRRKVKADFIGAINACTIKTPNDTAKYNYYLAKEYMAAGDMATAIKYYAISAECDMRLSVKAYNALFELARQLFKTGDIERADRYMRLTLKDAYASHYKSRYDDVSRSEIEIMNVLLEEQTLKRRAYLIATIVVTVFLLVAVFSLFLAVRYSRRLDVSRAKLAETSKIKDDFLAIYMEKCVDYLNKVDEYRSSLRKAAKEGGPAEVNAMLRRPSFVNGEFENLLNNFDSAFLGIFPDFIEKVNAHMQEEYRFNIPDKAELSTELRILALIRMGITKRQKIAKVLNMSVTTVYSYHSNLQKHSIHNDSSFDKEISCL